MNSHFKNISKYLGPIVYRNLITLVNLIVGSVVVLLFFFGEFRDGLFIASVLSLNIIIAIIQEIRARMALEKLQALVAQKVIKINDNHSEEEILIDEIQEGDRLKLKLGDQVPADSILYITKGFEVNESLLTGESDNIFKQEGENLFAGSIVVAGSAIVEVKSVPTKSYVTEMTKKIKKYSISQSQIQKSIGLFIEYMGYLLIAIVIFIVIRGEIIKLSLVSIIKEIAALSTTIVPEGLILATTLLFAYGAIRLFKEKVLLQQINATESLGRIKNLCVDKTGTLTENQPKVDKIIFYDGKDIDRAKKLTLSYIKSTDDKSETAKAIQQFIDHDIKIGPYLNSLKTLPFSSTRKYGCAVIEEGATRITITVGAPDILLNYINDNDQKRWLITQIDYFAPKAKRLVLTGLSKEPLENNTLDGHNLEILALSVLSNPLREGTREIIGFFKERGVQVRVISGDNPGTVQAIAAQAGIEDAQNIMTGQALKDWTEHDYIAKAGDYHAFARIKPDQKEMIITGLRKNGFTAMVGDGANDALAIKKADLGIAMFDGAAATRQIAQIILTNNSFAALPKGINLADSIISTLELVASIFFNKVAAGLSLFFYLKLGGKNIPYFTKKYDRDKLFYNRISNFLLGFFSSKENSKS